MSETFGVWELLTRLGQNELGETHLAIRRTDQARGVLKRFAPSIQADVSFYGPLKLELKFASQLQHPSAAAVLEQGEHNGIAFVVLEHIDGTSLAKLCLGAKATGGWPFSIDRAVGLMRPVLEALSAAHALTPPLLHRDLVPQNVLVTREGRVVLTDFGLGRARLRAGTSTLGMRRAYVSPEQARGNATDPRSEVFAAGLMLFELVCGRLPAEGGAGEVISRIATGELDAPLAVNPMLDDAAVAVLKRALAVRPEDRFANTREFFEALAPWTTPSQAEPLAAWVTRLDAVKLEAPAASPKPISAALVTTAVTEAVKPSKPRKGRPIWWIGLGLGAVALVGSQLYDVRMAQTPTVDPMTAGRPLELLSIPSGAQVYVDGVLQDRRTPLTISIPKDELRNLMLRKSGYGIWSGHISNTSKLTVTLASGALDEERYEGSRPAMKKEPEPIEQSNDDAPIEPKKEVVFDAESPPIEVELTVAHSVKGDLGPTVDIAAGSEVSLGEGATLFTSPSTPSYGKGASNRMGLKMPKAWGTTGTGSFRTLNLFALLNTAGVVEVFDLSKPVVFTKAGNYHLFSPTERGELSNSTAYVKLNDTSIALNASNLLRVEQDDSFLIRVLSPKVTYRVELTRADGSTAPLPAVLMSMRPDKDSTNYRSNDQENSLRFDGQSLAAGQTLVGAGAHTISGARNVWFTIVTAEGVVPPSVKLSVRPASKKRP